jgi:hypothetical protein
MPPMAFLFADRLAREQSRAQNLAAWLRAVTGWLAIWWGLVDAFLVAVAARLPRVGGHMGDCYRVDHSEFPKVATALSVIH